MTSMLPTNPALFHGAARQQSPYFTSPPGRLSARSQAFSPGACAPRLRHAGHAHPHGGKRRQELTLGAAPLRDPSKRPLPLSERSPSPESTSATSCPPLAIAAQGIGRHRAATRPSCVSTDRSAEPAGHSAVSSSRDPPTPDHETRHSDDFMRLAICRVWWREGTPCLVAWEWPVIITASAEGRSNAPGTCADKAKKSQPWPHC